MVNGNHMSSSPAFLYTQLHGGIGRREREVGAAGAGAGGGWCTTENFHPTKPSLPYCAVCCDVM